jgi:hypothetical protein
LQAPSKTCTRSPTLNGCAIGVAGGSASSIPTSMRMTQKHEQLQQKYKKFDMPTDMSTHNPPPPQAVRLFPTYNPNTLPHISTRNTSLSLSETHSNKGWSWVETLGQKVVHKNTYFSTIPTTCTKPFHIRLHLCLLFQSHPPPSKTPHNFQRTVSPHRPCLITQPNATLSWCLWFVLRKKTVCSAVFSRFFAITLHQFYFHKKKTSYRIFASTLFITFFLTNKNKLLSRFMKMS